MRLPRRTPFEGSRKSQLLAVYRHLYPNSAFLAEDHDNGDQSSAPIPDPNHALSIVQLWMNRSSCPYAVESTASLIQAILLDEHMQHINAAAGSSFASTSLEAMGGGAELGIRMNYTMAITRFVNSIVDSYQSGNFAQSIAAIAARIGLPHWFVELRHAGTHEDLPSLSVCREATRAALDWLHRNFWVPTLFAQQGDDEEAAVASKQPEPNSTIVQVRAEPSEEDRRKERVEALEQLASLLRSYKKLGKAIIRDKSLAGRQRAEVIRLFKAIQNWTNTRMMAGGGASKLIASRMGRKRTREEIEEESGGGGWTDVSNGYDVEVVRAAMRDLVDALLTPGGMVPLSRSKRVRASAQDDKIVLPEELEETWSPLIAYLRLHFGLPFLSVLFEKLFASLAYVAPETTFETQTESVFGFTASGAEAKDWRTEAWPQPTYKKTSEAWLRHLFSDDDQMLAEDVSESHNGVARTLETALTEQCLRWPSEGAISLLGFLSSTSPKLSTTIKPLLPILESTVGLRASDLSPVSAEYEDSGARPAVAAAAGETADVELDPAANDKVDTGADIVVVKTGFEEGLNEMEQRLEQLNRMNAEVEAETREVQVLLVVGRQEQGGDGVGAGEKDGLPPGWSRAGATWMPTPIGCLDGRVPMLSGVAF